MEKRAIDIVATADLHYDISRSRKPTEQIARDICRMDADALVLVGDSAGADLNILRDCLRLFDGFAGRKLFVPGNHCLWRPDEREDSLARYERTVPAVAAEAGFVVLDHEPQIVGHVGLVGSIGWYDYSFRDRTLGIPLDFYRAKVAPGAARYYNDTHAELLERHADQLDDRHYAITTRWMDGQFVRLGMSDEAFTERLAERLSRQLAALAPKVERIAAFLHHLPFAELVPPDRPAKFAFAAAYMGSARFGEALLREPKVRNVLCGHSHWPARHVIDGVEVVNIGSTYTHKCVERLTI